MKKILKWIGIGFAVLFVLTLVITVASPGGQESFEKGYQQGKDVAESKTSPTTVQTSTEATYTLDANAEVNGKRIKVTGTSNLPNGTILDVIANRMVIFKGESEERGTLEGRGISKASVFNGAFTTNVSLVDSSFTTWLNSAGDEVSKVSPSVTVKVVLDPKRSNPAQDSEVLKAIGINGEQLASSPNKKVIGERTNTPTNQLETSLTVSLPYIK